MIKIENYTYDENGKLSRENISTNEEKLNNPDKYIEFKISNGNYPEELLQFPEFIADLTAIITNIGLVGFKNDSNEIIAVYDIQSYNNINFENIQPDYFDTMINYNEVNNPFGLRRIKYKNGFFLSEYSITSTSISGNTSKYCIIDADALLVDLADSGPTIFKTSNDNAGFFEHELTNTILFNYKPAFIFNRNVNVKVYKNTNELVSIPTMYDSNSNTYVVDLSNINPNPNNIDGYVYISLTDQTTEGYLEVY